MKVKHYNEMMAYLTRPGFNGGGSVSNNTVLPKRKPAAEVKKRKKINYEKIKQYLGKESQDLVERELGFAIGGGVSPNQLKQRFMEIITSIQEAEAEEVPMLVAEAKDLKDKIDELNKLLSPERQIQITSQGLDFDNPLLDAAKIQQSVKPIQDIVPKSLTTENPILKGVVPDFPRGDKGTGADPEEKEDIFEREQGKRIATRPDRTVTKASMQMKGSTNLRDMIRDVLKKFDKEDLTATEGSFADGGRIGFEPGGGVFKFNSAQAAGGGTPAGTYPKTSPADLKKVRDYLTSLPEGSNVGLQTLQKEIGVDRGTVRLIVQREFPNLNIGGTTAMSENMKKVNDKRKAEGFRSQVDMEEYTKDLRKKFEFPVGSKFSDAMSNKELAIKYFGEGSKQNIARVERISAELKKELKLEYPKGDPNKGYITREERKKKFTPSSDDKYILNKQKAQKKALNTYFKNNPEEILNSPKVLKMLNAKLIDGKLDFSPRYDSEKKYIDLAKEGKLFDEFDITPIRSERRGIMYPVNKTISVGKFNQGIIKSIEAYYRKTKGSNSSEVLANKQAIDNYLKEVGVRVDVEGIKIGEKVLPAIDRKTGDLPNIKNTLEKLGVGNLYNVKPSGGVTLGSNFANVNREMLDFRKLPDDVKDVGNVIRNLIKTPGGKRIARNIIKGGKFTGLGLAGELAFAAPFVADDYASGLSKERIIGNAFLASLTGIGQSEDEEIRKAVGERGYATQTLNDLSQKLPVIEDQLDRFNDQNDPTGAQREKFTKIFNNVVRQYDQAYDLFVSDAGVFDKELYNQGVNNYAAGLGQIEKFRAAKEKERGVKEASKNVTGFELDLNFAGGGLAKGAGDESGPPPESGPTPQGLASIIKRGRKY